MMPGLVALPFRCWLLAAGFAVAAGGLGAQTKPPVAAENPGASPPAAAEAPAAGAVQVVRDNDPVKLEPVNVQAKADDDGFDATGTGSYQHQLRDSPFSNDMISAETLEDDPVAMEIAMELGIIATPSAVDLATGDSRLNLRGFPTPLLNNGFVRMGGLDVLNLGRTLVIQGALVPVLGRGAPGGIQDIWPNLPRTARSRRADYSVGSLRRQSASVEFNTPLVPKRLWHRFAADWSRRTGPESYAASETRSLYTAVTWRRSPAASLLFSVDFMQVHATSAQGIPEFREATGKKIAGPYLPLAGFNSLGPEAGIRRRSLVANVFLDAQPHPKIAVRAGVEAWWRRIEQDRFTTSVLNLSTGRFDGTREPRHSEQPQHAQVARGEATARFAALRGEHKLMLAASHTISSYLREERALSLAHRNALPASVRLFNPAAPDYSRPAYHPDTYSRILTDRRERARFTAVELTERMGILQGRWVFTAGVRQDFVGLRLHDRRVGLTPAQARLTDTAGQLTHHAGVNYQARPSRLLLFATSSTAFNPSTRVDLRTGRIQGNETTRGYEAGLKARFAPQQLDVTASGFTFFNQDISRRNPLYDDPVFDANHTQPQLVSAGEERFTGAKLEGRWRPRPPLSFTLRATYVRAITTASPDLPEEVGRTLTRFPSLTVGSGASFAFPAGRYKGLSLSASWIYVSRYVATYEDRARYRLDYPGYGTVALSASYSLRRGTYTHGFGLAIRNLFDTDLVAKLARMGAGREFSASYRLMW